MNFLAFFLGYHDSNVAIAVDGKVKYIQSERLTGLKHHQADIAFVKEICDAWGIHHFDAIAFSDVGNHHKMGTCEVHEFAKEVQPLWENVPTFRVDHHYAHILSAWPLTDLTDIDVGVAIDGEGDAETRCRVIAQPGSGEPKLLHYSKEYTFGWVMRDIGDMMGLSGRKLDYAGKIMGINAYGTIDQDYVAALDLHDISPRLLDLIYAVPWRGKLPAHWPKLFHFLMQWKGGKQTYRYSTRLRSKSVHHPNFFNFNDPSFLDWIATVHYVCELDIIQLFERFCEKEQRIIFAGGCAQNSVCNDKLARLYPHLVVPPHCNDGGMSLGCLEFLRLHYQQPQFCRDAFPFWQSDDDGGQASEATIKKVVELLLDGKIVGWFQGYGEVGPRALGHRSILMDPRLKEAKQILNSRVKHREHWRPYAPSVLQSKASEWFDIKEASPYMLRAVKVHTDRQASVPAIVHQDGTSRIQTVADDGSNGLASYVQLLSRFYEHTGVPMLLNTSLNAGGSPIFGRRKQGLQFFQEVDMDALCIGDELFIK